MDELEALRNDSAYVFSSRKGNNAASSHDSGLPVVKANGDRVGVQVSPHFLRHSTRHTPLRTAATCICSVSP
ncbi:hypothetical protein [Synechococcus sp. 7002]|uniref:hypothetical protein n=1 Tax=Synechococcus sp. 7002 TaxID=1938862 RepID=UPI001356493D|nr:hypothetical protein [Synechococcus sp. 7002]